MKSLRSVLPLLLAGMLSFPSGNALSQQDISEFEKRVGRINEQIKDLKAKVAEAGRKESSVLASLEKIGLTKELLRSELRANTLVLQKTDSERKSMMDDIARQRAGLDREKQSIERTLVTLYKFGRFDFFEFALKTGTMENLFSQSKHLAYLARSQEAVVQRYLESLSGLVTAESRLESKQKEVADLIRVSAEKKKELDKEEKSGRELVAGIQKNRKSYEQALEELNESAKQLQELIRKMGSQEYALPFPLVPLYEKKGKLPWPIAGRIITAFGLQKHPRFNTATLNNGIEISPSKDKTVILAVHPGRIVYSDVFEGYGNLIIVDHGMSYYSLYGHCSEFLAKKGDVVKAGQPVALVGDTGSLKGECLYFELRFKTKALDPLQWLQRR